VRGFSRALIFGGISLILVLLHAMPAQAQATRTWVSGVGDDANPCSRTAPCKTFAGAISKTAANGEINAIDAGAFGTVTITKSITINTEGLESGVLGTGVTGITVNAGANDVVVLRGLDIDGSQGAAGSPGLNGIRFLAGGALHVQKCLIRNFKAASPNGFGINFAPTGTSFLFVTDTFISNNGTPAAGAGIGIQPTGAGSATVTLNRVQVDGNFSNGIILTSASGTAARAVVKNTVVSGGSVNGISVVASVGGAASTFVDGSTIVGNIGTGIRGDGAIGILVSDSTITLNGIGISTVNGASIFSYHTNRMDNNGTNGTFTPPDQPLK